MVPTYQDPLRRRFEEGSLAPAELDHRAHLRLCHAYLAADDDFGRAAVRFREALRRYTVTVGASGKYHETITWAYLALVREAIEERPAASADELLEARPDLLDHRAGALARIYDVAELTADPLARRLLVLPRRR